MQPRCVSGPNSLNAIALSPLAGYLAAPTRHLDMCVEVLHVNVQSIREPLSKLGLETLNTDFCRRFTPFEHQSIGFHPDQYFCWIPSERKEYRARDGDHTTRSDSN